MAPPLYMDAVITLNRSLSPAGFKAILAVVVTVNVFFGVFFFTIGAWPAPIFMGIDILLVWLAFRASFRAAERAERVQVSAEQVVVTHEDGEKRKRVWASPTAFTRVSVETRDETDARVRLLLSGKAYTVARALSPPERSAFAAALQDAIRRARAERY